MNPVEFDLAKDLACHMVIPGEFSYDNKVWDFRVLIVANFNGYFHTM